MHMAAAGLKVALSRVRIWLLIAASFLASHGDLPDFSASQSQFVLEEISEAHVLGSGRLTSMPYPSGRLPQESSTRFASNLADSDGGSPAQRRLLSLFYILDRQPGKAQNELRQLSLEFPDDAGIHNDLGVVDLELALLDRRELPSALAEFESATALRPDFPEANFNLIIAGRRLGLHKVTDAAGDRYQHLDSTSPWRLLIGTYDKPEDDETSLRERIETAHPEDIPELAERYPSGVFKLVRNFALRPVLPVPPNYRRAAEELSRQNGDETLKAALAVLSSTDAQSIVQVRDLVARSRRLYERSVYAESRALYDRARQIIAHTDSPFDHVWLEINAADTMQMSLDYSHALDSYRDAGYMSTRYHFKWLQARVLSSMGSKAGLSGGVIDDIANLNEAIGLYRQIGETTELARPLYFLGLLYSNATSYEESLKLLLECVDVADPADHYRLAAADLIVARNLSQFGQTGLAIHFEEEATDHAIKLGNPMLLGYAKLELAKTFLSNGSKTDDARTPLKEARELLPEMPLGDRETTASYLADADAQVLVLSGKPSEAESALRDSLKFESENKAFAAVKDYDAQILLADALMRQGRTAESAAEVRKAIEFVETDQDNLPKDSLQISFDHNRHSVYDSAVRLTYKLSGCREAWNLAQQYKAKLFLNSMQGFGPSPGGGLSLKRLTLDEVQHRIPDTIQIVDYFALRDELMVWVISKDAFDCESVPVTASQLQQKIGLFVSQLIDRRPSDKIGQELYDVLVEPILHALEPRRAVMIVPDASLYRLPFAALQSRATGRYWIETTPIAETPSVTYLLSGVVENASPSGHVAFGSRRYDALTSAELRSIQQTDPGIRFESGPEVTKASFLQALHDNSVIYYAGHSAFDRRNALQSSILLDGDRSGPNTVSALDIMQRRIRKNALVVLSSCETSLGSTTDGVGIGGLTSAFLLGGAGTVVGSLWPVESASTMQLMSRTFESLIGNHEAAAESLRAAQLVLIRDPATRHPYYWSGFIVTGNRSAVR